MTQPTNRKPSALEPAISETTLNLVEYQPGAVVSRVIVKGPAGNVTLFAFEEGEGLSEHTAPFDALVQVIDGEAQITIAGQPHNVIAGELILLPANVPHALDAVKRFKMILTMLRSLPGEGAK